MMGELNQNKIGPDILEAAADYYLALQEDTMTAEGLQEWQLWLAASDEHRRAFTRLETLWGVLADVPAAQIRAVSVHEIRDAAPAWTSGRTPAPVQTGGSVLSLVAPAGKARVSEVRTIGWMTGMAASVAAVFMAGYLFFAPADKTARPAPISFETQLAEQRVVKLADGSIVELGAESRISVDYTGDERRLTLEGGQAVFTVAKNPRRPFVVQAGQGSVTAIGTVFNVRKSNRDIEVRVLEGTVAVRPIDEAGQRHNLPDVATAQVALVTAGNVTGYTSDGAMRPILPADVQQDLAWRVGVLTMVDWPLGDVIHELNRYLEHEITIGDESIKTFRFTGTVYPDQVQAWLDGLQEGYPIKVVHLGTSRILMVADNNKADSGR